MVGSQPSLLEPRERTSERAPAHVRYKLSKPRTRNHASGSHRLSKLVTNSQSPSLLHSGQSSPWFPQESHTLLSTLSLTEHLDRSHHHHHNAHFNHQTTGDYTPEEEKDNPSILDQQPVSGLDSITPKFQAQKHDKWQSLSWLTRSNSTLFEPGMHYHGEALTTK